MMVEIYSLIDNNIPGNKRTDWSAKCCSLRSLLYILKPQVSFVDDDKLKILPGYISFNVLNSAGIVDKSKKRVRTKTSRFLTRKLGLNNYFLNDITIAKIAHSIDKTFFGNDYKLRLDSGSKITENYRKEVGGSSCMTGNYAEYTRFYEMNPDSFKQIILTFNNNSARAILSTLDNGKKYCDRIYSTNIFIYDLLLNYVESKGWYFRETFDYANLGSDLIISNLKWQDGLVPYMDTFHHFKIQKDNLLQIFKYYSHSFLNEDRSIDGNMDHCEGWILGESSYCISCDERHDENNMRIINGECWCERCQDNYLFDCNQCSHSHHTDNSFEVEGEQYCESCYEEFGYCCDNCENNIFLKNTVKTNLGIFCMKCLEDYKKCCVCWDWFNENDNMWSYDDKNYCKECFDAVEKEEKKDE
ncbi:MAG TPA: hypothetical protein ENH85_06220 [Candidatus Scalindua sp.]|nr:hypothetical protein [Candidatus Scalindua sp.]